MVVCRLIHASFSVLYDSSTSALQMIFFDLVLLRIRWPSVVNCMTGALKGRARTSAVDQSGKVDVSIVNPNLCQQSILCCQNSDIAVVGLSFGRVK